MTFYEKYPQLQDKAFVTEMLSGSVYATVALENEEVSGKKVRDMAKGILSEVGAEPDQFLLNEPS